MKDYLVYHLRTMEIKVFFWDLAMRSEENINEILPKLAEFSWWENRGDLEWNEHETFAFYTTLQAAASTWNKELITWLLDEWKVSLKPPSIYQWEGLSIPDVVAMGKHVDETILTDLGDAKNVNNYYHHYTKKYFDMKISTRWKDGQCNSLIKTLRPLIYRKGAADQRKNKWFEALVKNILGVVLMFLRFLQKNMTILELNPSLYLDSILSLPVVSCTF
ncbi:hypothetical protein GOP47_0024347 [Adiantum capillus-veneris]|uniref:Uncharacterized protein n=1 Tax=Adiantum capillus-veneris TaxID=13818 RepID=A0A9D4U238_ADICA|nr:hypothetical protein GOP47_0024347 [Adiantum capillus-veneris]